MRVYVLEFDTRDALSRGFARLLDDAHVEACSAETEKLRVRFLSPKDAGDLVHRIYQEGGLRWCVGHRGGAKGATL